MFATKKIKCMAEGHVISINSFVVKQVKTALLFTIDKLMSGPYFEATKLNSKAFYFM